MAMRWDEFLAYFEREKPRWQAEEQAKQKADDAYWEELGRFVEEHPIHRPWGLR